MRSKTAVLGGTVLFLSALGCEPTPAPEEPAEEATRGRLVIVGGALQDENTAVYQAVVDGRSGEGPLCIIPTASADPEASMEEYISAFNSVAGEGAAQGILLSVDNGERADDEEVARQMRLCSGFFFTGGSQSRIMDVFEPGGEATLASQVLRERFEGGAVVSGSSAGAAIMTDPMISGGGSMDALEWGISVGGEGEGVRLRSGFGFLNVGLVDQHFLARGRWARLMVAVLGTSDDPFGFGIDENTALVVEGDSAWVVGESGVVFMDGRVAEDGGRGDGAHGIRLFLLGRGDKIRLSTGEVLPHPTKELLEVEGAFQEPLEADPFARWALLHLLREFGTAEDQGLTLHRAQHSMEFQKEPGFRALAWEGLGIQDTPLGLFMGPFVVRVSRE